VAILVMALCGASLEAFAGPPPQNLPSALLVYPLVEANGATDTRIQLVNLSGDPQEVQCFYVRGSSCVEVGFFLTLTPFQPLSWFASAGLYDPFGGSAAPPFFGVGELKCAVVPARPEADDHNAIQGRATVFGTSGRTVSYGAVGFQRLADGEFTGVFSLNGSTYSSCPSRLRFHISSEQPGAGGELILVPCSQDLLLQVPTTVTVQFLIVNEFEQTFSASNSFSCYDRRSIGSITHLLQRSALGSDTAQLIVRSSGSPLLGLVIDEVSLKGTMGTAGNEPSLHGSRSATVVFP
jgi:hypothetical protein